MALGVEGRRAGRVIVRASILTFATFLFALSLTLVYESMRSVMEIGGSCASGGPHVNAHPCPDNVVWAMPLGIFGMMIAGGLSLLGTFSEGGPRPYVFGWSILFLALGWNFLDYGVHPPSGGTSWSWLICGVVFVLMAAVPLIFLLVPSTFRWATWGPDAEVVPGAGRAGTHHSPADLVRMARAKQAEAAAAAPTPAATSRVTASGPYNVLKAEPTPYLDEEPTA